MSSHGDSHGHDDHGSDKKKDNNWPLKVVVGLAALIFIIVIISKIGSHKSNSNTASSDNTTSSSNNTNTSLNPNISIPAFQINGEWSEEIDITPGYTTSFTCSEDYEIMNLDGTIFKANANEDVNIGWTTANRKLRFRTQNGNSTKMKIDLLLGRH